jgi:glucosylceramidase
VLEEQLNSSQRKNVMRRLFDPRSGHGIGISFVCVPLGASDLSRNHYSYDDMPPGQRDLGLRRSPIAVKRQLFAESHPHNLQILS